MQITYSEKLKQYMQQKNLTHIEISVVEPSGCCMGFSEIVVNFVNEKDMPTNGRNWRHSYHFTRCRTGRHHPL